MEDRNLQKVSGEEEEMIQKIKCFFGYHVRPKSIKFTDYFDKVIVHFVCADCLRFVTRFTKSQ